MRFADWMASLPQSMHTIPLTNLAIPGTCLFFFFSSLLCVCVCVCLDDLIDDLDRHCRRANKHLMEELLRKVYSVAGPPNTAASPQSPRLGEAARPVAQVHRIHPEQSVS